LKIKDHVLIEDKPIPLYKDNEKFFLAFMRVNGRLRSGMWVWDSIPGEMRKGLLIFIQEYSFDFTTLGEALRYFKSKGFNIKHPYHKIPKWLGGEQLKVVLKATLAERFIEQK
jgi:hypothetical protein